MPAIDEPMCRVRSALQIHQLRQHSHSIPPLFTTYIVKDIFYVMEKNISNEHMSNTSQNHTPASSSVTSIPTPVNTKVYPKPKFLKFLQSVGAEGTSFEIPKIINYLKKYVFSKKLFNQEKPWLVHCDDQLRKVFRCKQFTIREVRGLLNQNVTLFESSNNTDTDDEDESFDSDATEIVSSSDNEPPKKNNTSQNHTPASSSVTSIPTPVNTKATPLDDIISSSTSEQPKPVVNSAGPLFRLKPSFLEILHDAGAKGELFSEKEIFRHLKNYVWSRRLFHPLHQWICLCQNDKLANVFKCDKFVIPDVPYLVAKFGVDYPTYHPKVRRGSSDLIPKSVNNVTVPLRSYNSAPSCTRSTPSDITSSTADAISPIFTEKLEHLSGRSKDNGLALSKESSFTMLSKSVENSSTVADKSEVNTSVTPERAKEGDYLALGNSKENCSTAANKREENSSPKATNRCEESQSSQPYFSHELTASSSAQRNNSFTLTLKMQDDNEVLNLQDEKPMTDDDDDEDVYVEYEVMSNSSSFHMSESEDEHHEVSMGMLVICQDSDLECYADYSEDGSDTDVELSDADKWCCSTCHLYNSPIHRFCDRCWTQRPGWLPDRDRPSSSKHQDNSLVKRKQGSHHIKNLTKNSLDKLRTKDKSANLSSEDDISSDEASQHSDNFVRSSSRPPTPSDSSLDLQNLVNKECNETLDLRTTLSNICHFAESEVPAQQNQSRNLKRNLISDSNESDFVSKFPKMSSPVKNFVAPGNCIICLQNPRDASLIHGASGHQICCLYCAKKLKEQGRRCPICRQSIQKVVRNYLA